jgi:hypothetical protein
LLHGYAAQSPLPQQTSVVTYHNDNTRTGACPAADVDGHVCVVPAKGDFSTGNGAQDYGDSVFKRAPAPRPAVADFFAPFHQNLFYPVVMSAAGAASNSAWFTVSVP